VSSELLAKARQFITKPMINLKGLKRLLPLLCVWWIALKFGVGVKTVATVSFPPVIVLITHNAIEVVVAICGTISYVIVLFITSDFIVTLLSSYSDI
jgi:hypothetical protein